MSDKLTLWQRCEALGPQNKDRYLKMDFKEIRDTTGIVWVITHNGVQMIKVYHDGRVYGNEWLAEAIVRRFETLNNPESLEAQHHSAPKEPTREQCHELFHFIAQIGSTKSLGFDIEGNVKSHEMLVTLKQDPKFGFSITRQSYYGYHPDLLDSNRQVTFSEACEMVGFHTFEIGDTVEVFRTDPMDDHVGIDLDKRWHVGEQFVITDIQTHPWGTFLCDAIGHTLKPSRARIVKKANPLPLPETLENHRCSYVAESAKESVRIPAKEWHYMQGLATQLSTDLDSLKIMLRLSSAADTVDQPTTTLRALNATETHQIREFLRMAIEVAPIFDAMSKPIQIPK